MENKLFKNRYAVINYFLLAVCCVLFLMGCATNVTTHKIATKPEITAPGIYHRIQKGETLWRISEIYGISLEEILRVNGIPDAAKIEIDQLVFIPQRQKQTPTYKSYLPEDFIWPFRGKIIARFGETFNNMINKGINIQPYYRTQNIVAVRSGKIVFYSDNLNGLGKTVIIDHGDGLSTVYARNSQVFIKVGDSVQRGAVIAKVGFAGRDKNIYLHFQIRKGHIPQNPLFYLPPHL
jgi:hypothetical protein